MLDTETKILDIIDKQTEILNYINDTKDDWDSKASKTAPNFTGHSTFSDSIYVEKSIYIGEDKVPNHTIFITNKLSDTIVSIARSSSTAKAILNVDDSIVIDSNITIDSDSIRSNSLLKLNASNEIDIKNSAVIINNSEVSISPLLKLSNNLKMTNLLLKDNSISSNNSMLLLQSNEQKNNGAYILLTDKNYLGKSAYTDLLSSSLQVITSADNNPALHIYHTKNSKFFGNVSSPSLTIGSSDNNSSFLQFIPYGSIRNDWVIDWSSNNFTIRSVDNSNLTPQPGNNIISFVRQTITGSSSNNIGRVYFGEPLASTTGGYHEITFNFDETNPSIYLGGKKVLTTSNSGWTIPSDSNIGSISRDINTLKSTTVTLDQVASILRGVVFSLLHHGLIGA